MATNHFANLQQQIQKTQPNQWAETLIQGIVEQLQQSGNTTTMQYAQELNSVSSQLTQACNQQQGQRASV